MSVASVLGVGFRDVKVDMGQDTEKIMSENRSVALQLFVRDNLKSMSA